LGEPRITEILICQEFTDEAYSQEFYDLIRMFRKLGITERYGFPKRDMVWDYVQLSEKGVNLANKLKDDDLRRYFIVAITIYCNQKKFSSNELSKLLSETDSFESKDEVEEIIENFRKKFIIEEKPAVVAKISKMAIEIKDCVFDVFIIEESKQDI